MTRSAPTPWARGNQVSITAVVADLTQPTGPGTKKALARIR
jgi:hypothetical protein